MLTKEGEIPDHQKTELKAIIQKRFETDERVLALVRMLGRSAAARDHALQLKIEEAADKTLQKGNN